jgi:hypothetical protein
MNNVSIIVNFYQEYLYVIGKLKDVHGLHVDVDHKDVHTFYKGKQQLFKLLHGTFSEDGTPTIVVTFQIELDAKEIIQWYLNVSNVHPMVKMMESYFEDVAGEIFYGEDAKKLLTVKHDQQCIKEYLAHYDTKGLREFASAKVVGRERDPKKLYISHLEMDQAIKEFETMKKPVEDDEVH